jgi:hypothetical protein
MTRVQTVIRTMFSQLSTSHLTGVRSGTVASPAELAAGPKAVPALMSLLRPLSVHATTAWKWIEAKRSQQLASRRIRVAETVSLGEKRFVSIVQVDGKQFLIGGSTGSVSLLAVLEGQSDGAAWRQAQVPMERLK